MRRHDYHGLWYNNGCVHRLFDRQSIEKLVALLEAPLEKKRRVITARITLTNGDKCYVVCAPILSKKQTVNGMALLIARNFEPSYSKLIRLLANKIAKQRHAEPSSTKLLNRIELVAKINATLEIQPTLPHSLIYYDADKMHTINDAFGYSGGDSALSRFKNILVDSAGANDSVAHMGSDRFAMFLPGASGDTAVAKATQVLQILNQESIDNHAKSINLSASAGVVDNSAASKG
ncbi:MAG: GGDEF domain-containing protein, partial [Woeseiales bacterium]